MAHVDTILNVLKMRTIKSKQINRKHPDTKITQLQENWRKEFIKNRSKKNVKNNYQIFTSVLFSPVSICLIIAFCIEFYDSTKKT